MAISIYQFPRPGQLWQHNKSLMKYNIICIVHKRKDTTISDEWLDVKDICYCRQALGGQPREVYSRPVDQFLTSFKFIRE